MNFWELAAFLIYFIVVLGVGFYFFFRSKGTGEKAYFLGDRQMSGLVAALSAGASDMSSWVLMGLPASILVFGMGKVWIAIGLAIGTFLSWFLMAGRLRHFSMAADDAITIPQYLTNRFLSKSKALQIVCAVVFLVVYAVYSASSIKACGTLFNTVLGIDPNLAMYIATAIIVVYTFFGGFNAVCWTDFFQGLLMLAALLATPIVALFILNAGGVDQSAAAALPEHYWNFLPSGKLDWNSISSILTGLGWGLGYFGMPHILVRYMSIRSAKEVRKSRVIGVGWTFLILLSAAAVGLVGRVFLPELSGDTSSLVFIEMVRKIFPAFLSGVLLSAILAASMSTADSQLLASASAFASDVYKPVLRKNASDKEMSWVSRFVVMGIAVAAMIIAITPGSGSIMDLVECAWGAFGAAFGPAILLSLFWKRFTYHGAVSGIIAGAVTDIAFLLLFTDFNASMCLYDTQLYEIIPGFIVSMAVCILVTCLGKKPQREVEELFDRAISMKD